MLERELGKFTQYTCSDAMRFRGNIGMFNQDHEGDIFINDTNIEDVAIERAHKRKLVLERIEKLQDIDREIEGSNIGATLGAQLGYTETDIKNAAEKINLSKSGVCTTFALAGADALLELMKANPLESPIQRVEIVARPAGFRGTHCFVVVNREPDSSIEDISTWGPYTLVVDPWLASLQNPVVYYLDEFMQSNLLDGMLEVNFDTATPSLAKDKMNKSTHEKEMRKAFRQYIDSEDLSALSTLLEETPDFENIVLGPGGLNAFTYAISQNKQQAFSTLLEWLPNKNMFMSQHGGLLLKYAIESGNLDLFYEVLNSGVEMQHHSWLIHDAFNVALERGDDRFFRIFFSELSQYDTFNESILAVYYMIPLLKEKFPNLITPYLLALPLSDAKQSLAMAEAELEIYVNANNILKDINAAHQARLELLKVDENEVALSRKPVRYAGPKPDSNKPPPLPKNKLLFSKAHQTVDREKVLRKEHKADLENLARHIEEEFGYSIPATSFAHMDEYIEKRELMKRAFEDYIFTYNKVNDALTKEKLPVSVRIKKVKCSIINAEARDLLTDRFRSVAEVHDFLVGDICDERKIWVANYTLEQFDDLRIQINQLHQEVTLVNNERDAALSAIELKPEALQEVNAEIIELNQLEENLIMETQHLLDQKIQSLHKPSKPSK